MNTLRLCHCKHLLQIALLCIIVHSSHIYARKNKGLNKKCLKKICQKTFADLDKNRDVLLGNFQEKLRKMRIPLAQYGDMGLPKSVTSKLQRITKSNSKIPKKYRIRSKMTKKVVQLAMKTYTVLRWYKSALPLVPHSGMNCLTKRSKREIFPKEVQKQCSSSAFKRSCVHAYIENAEELLEALHVTHKQFPDNDLIMRCLYKKTKKAEKKIKKILPKSQKDTCGILSTFIYDNLQDSVTKIA